MKALCTNAPLPRVVDNCVVVIMTRTMYSYVSAVREIVQMMVYLWSIYPKFV